MFPKKSEASLLNGCPGTAAGIIAFAEVTLNQRTDVAALRWRTAKSAPRCASTTVDHITNPNY